MAQRQLKTALPVQFVDTRRADTTAAIAGLSTDGLGTPANFTDMTALDTRLTAIDSTKYSQAKLDTMTLNDKIYALRVADEATST